MTLVRTPEDERKKVLAWRAEMLWEAGLRDVGVATAIVQSDADIHLACKMLRQGCTPELLEMILT